MLWAALRVAASSLQASQRALEVGANNLANLQSPGFKSRRVAQVDLPPGAESFGDREAPNFAVALREVGRGVGVGAVLTNQARGPFHGTGQPLDVAIAGDGYLQVSLPDGRTAYTRVGTLQVDGEGRLTTAGGGLITPAVTVPPGSSRLSIEADGQVWAEVNGSERQPVGQVQLARFRNPDGLEALGTNLLLATPEAGTITTGTPGADRLGRLAPGQIEGSNVDMGEELVRTLQAQRAYGVGTRTLRAIDEMLQDANNLRR